MGLLDRLGEPPNLRTLSRAELKRLADVIREEIIRVVSENGGHLASNLGVVELTVALHTAFNFFDDRLFFDVSHQCYTHKLLTGRAKNFRSLRKKDGLSGFQNRDESESDPFTFGHAGTALSAALGTVAADEASGRKRNVVAVIGDGSLGAGNTFEALNHAGALGKNMLVILNDNNMAIAETVGALSNYLSRVRLAPTYHDIKREIYKIVERFPVFGSTMQRALDHLRELLRRSMVPGLMFEDLGFTYHGPVDGHDVDGLLRALDEVKRLDGPVLLHVITEKGRGYAPACENPERFHGAKGYLEDNGKIRPKSAEQPAPSYTKVFSDAMVDLGKRNTRLVAITAAMPEGTGLYAFAREYPDRFFDAGLSEQHALGFAAGLAGGGVPVVAAIYSTFLQRGYDQVFEELALQNLPVVLAVDRAGLVGNDGPTHHGAFDVAYLRTLPNLTLMAPKDGRELEDMLEFALSVDGPSAVRYPRASCPAEDFFQTHPPIEPGKAEVLRTGGDVCVVAYGTSVAEAEQAARQLEADGVKIGLVNARFAKPLDEKTILDCASRYGHIITVEEGSLAGGFGSAVLELVSDGVVDVKVHRLGIADRFMEHASRAEQLAAAGIDSDGIASAIKNILKGKPVEAKP